MFSIKVDLSIWTWPDSAVYRRYTTETDEVHFDKSTFIENFLYQCIKFSSSKNWATEKPHLAPIFIANGLIMFRQYTNDILMCIILNYIDKLYINIIC